MKDLAVHTRLNPENRNPKLLTFVKRLNSHPKCSADLERVVDQNPHRNHADNCNYPLARNITLAEGFTTSYNSYKNDWTREIPYKKFMVAKHFQNRVL